MNAVRDVLAVIGLLAIAGCLGLAVCWKLIARRAREAERYQARGVAEGQELQW